MTVTHCRNGRPYSPREPISDAFVRKSKRPHPSGNGDHGLQNDALSRSYSTDNVISAAEADAAAATPTVQLPGAVQDKQTTSAIPQVTQHAVSSEECTGIPSGSVGDAPDSSQSSPVAISPSVNEQKTPEFSCASPARVQKSAFTDEQEQLFQEAVLYLQLTVQGFSFSIGSHSRYCKSALRVLMSFYYISIMAVMISVYSGLPWLEKYNDDLGKAVHPWWAVYMDKSTILLLETLCVAFLFFDLVLNMFAQGARTFYREHPLMNVSYTVTLCWFLFDLISSLYFPGSRVWSQGFRPVSLVRSVPKLEQVVGVFASTLLKSLKLTFFAAIFLLITGCLSVVVTRYSCEKSSVQDRCTNLRSNWGSLDVSMLSSFVIITSSGYARLFEDFLSFLFSPSKGDKTGALNFSILLLMCAIVFGGALGMTALYTASVFDSFKKARSQQYLRQLGLEHRYLISSYIAACRAFEADEVDGLCEVQIASIIEAVIPRFRGHANMLSLLFRLIDVDQGGTVNVIEYCRLCGVIMLDFQIIHEGVPENTTSLDSSARKDMRQRRMAASGAAVLGLLQHVKNPGFAMQKIKHAVQSAWSEVQKTHPIAQRAALFLRRFCASRFARLSVFGILWVHLVLTVISAQIVPFKQDMLSELQGLRNSTFSYQYVQSLNDGFDVFIWTTSIYVALLLWTQYGFGIAKLNTAMIIIPVELVFVFLDLLNPVAGDFCQDCVWYARIFRSVRVPVIALSLEAFVPLMKAISQLLSTLAVYIAFFYIVLNLFTNLGHVAFRDLGFVHKAVPALSFSTLQQTLTIAVELSTADDWDEIRYDLYQMSKKRAYDVFFVFYYIVFNLCTTNVVTSLAIECFEYLHEKEANDDLGPANLHQQQAFDTNVHMQNDESYEMMLAPDGSREIWTGKNANHAFTENDSKGSIFSKETDCCLCNKPIVGPVLECSLCHVVLHFDCWQKTEAAESSFSDASGLKRFGRISFLRSTSMPPCISRLPSDALQMHFSVYVKKIVNLLDILILGPQVINDAKRKRLHL